MSTTFLSVMNFVGLGIGFVVTPHFVNNKTTETSKVQDLCFCHAIIASIVLTPSFFLFKSKPNHAPSRAADAKKFSSKESTR